MASVKVAVRVRPFNQREKDMNAKLIVQMEGKKTRLLTVKNSKEQNDNNREKYKDFTFDHSYWSYDNADGHYASQEQVFSELGVDVIDSAFEGYNACVFAYGQTGSGKTFTMMGSPDCQGLIPRICRQLFSRVAEGKESGASYRTEVSYLEIYNEKVKDLLANDSSHSLRVREHPKLGPYVQDLSKHLVSDYDDIEECMNRGNQHRTTASTQMNDVSSRSHAIFTVTFVQAGYLRHNMPCETVSKVHLVDLAGSERADATGATGQRLVEGAHINKSLVTLGSVISALADSAQQAAVDGRTPKSKKGVFIPYRDSVLTWLLKDSLGGNSKTIMIAAISPADCNYGETLSTLRYANRAKNIINKPTINEDPNVKLIRELREEIDKLRAQISLNVDTVDPESGVLATLQLKEAQEKVLTEKWTEKWRETQQILQEQKALGLRKSGLGVVLDSDMPHLVGIDDNLLSTGVTLYHLKEGVTIIGTSSLSPAADIVIGGAGVLSLHCRVWLRAGEATLEPELGAQCWLNTVAVDRPAKLSQGCILLLGRTNMFRYNDPAEAAKLRQEGSTNVMNLSRLSLLSWSATDLAASNENLSHGLSDIENDCRSERIEAQRAELERERKQFLQQQDERQKRWHKERELLIQAQNKLDEERLSMERSYVEACTRLSHDWRSLAAGAGAGADDGVTAGARGAARRALSLRHRELAARATRLDHTSDTHAHAARTEEEHAAALKREIEGKTEELEKYIKSTVRELVAQGCRLDETEPSEPDSSKAESTSCLLHLLNQCEPSVADNIRDTVERHKKELSELETELQIRMSSVASHRVKVERLQAELALLSAQDRGLREALRDDDIESPLDGVKRSKSELMLQPPRDAGVEPLSADECEDYRQKKFNLNLSLEPLGRTSPTFHTASEELNPFPSGASTPITTNTETSLPIDTKDDDPSPPPPLLPPLPRADDSDDLSSTEDYNNHPRIVDGQSSSSIDRSPEDRQQRARYRRRIGDKSGRRQVTEAEAYRAMQRLCQRIASQKMLVISSLENDCSKEDLNRQIAVLQDLQKKYVRLEMALQYSLFVDARRPVAPPVSATLLERAGEGDDPLTSRLKESEASDNVSTSNDELTEPYTWNSRSSLSSSISRNISSDCIDFASVVSVPGWVTRGAGPSTHHEYEVRVTVGDEKWSLLRRYRRFRELYITMKHVYGDKVANIPFPSRQLWPTVSTARNRRPQLETFLRRLLTVLATDPRCPYRARLTPDTLRDVAPFFRKGVFESGKCGTG